MNNLVIKAYSQMKANQTENQPIHVVPTPIEEVQEEVRKIQARSKELKESGLFDKEPIILTGKEQRSQFRLFATDIMCDMLTNLLNLKNGVKANDSSLNYDLEILQGGNLIMVDNFINQNISALRDSLERSFKYTIHEQDFQIITMLENSAERDAMIPVYERLHSYYIAESAASNDDDPFCLMNKAIKDPLSLMNKTIKMLLEAQVKGVYKKEHNANV